MINAPPADNSPWPTKSVDLASQGDRAWLHSPWTAMAADASPALARCAACRKAEDVASMVKYLLGEGDRNITGTRADGGRRNTA